MRKWRTSSACRYPKLLMVMVGLSLLFWSGYIAYSEDNFIKGALSTTGTYVGFRQAGLESSFLVYTIKYEPEGQTWGITEGGGQSGLVGKEVEVFYQPGNPSEGTTDKTRADAWLSTLIVAILVSVLLWKIVRFRPATDETA